MSSRNLQELEKKLKSTRLSGSAALDERVQKTLAEARSAAAGDIEMNTASAVISTTPRRPRTWLSSGLLMKAAGSLAAACLLAGGLVWIFLGNGGTASAYAFLEEAVANAKSAGWVHTRFEGPEENIEMWVRFKPFRQFGVEGDKVSLTDLGEKRRYSYDPETNTVLIEPCLVDDRALTESSNFLDALLTSLKESPDAYESLEDTEEVIDGKKYRVLSIAAQESSMRVIIDGDLLRVVRYEAKRMVEGEPVQVMAVVFDYPATGPEDIYALGVPRDAIIENRVNESVISIRESEHQAREAFAPTYFAIVYKGREAGDGGVTAEKINVVYKKNGRLRVEEYPALPWGESTGSYDLKLRLPTDDMGAVEREISKRKLWRVYFAEPGEKLPTLVGFDDDYAIKAVRTRIGIGQFIPEGISWPGGMPVTGTATIPGRATDFGYLVAAEKTKMGRVLEDGMTAYAPHRERWYYNRERDWILEEWTNEFDAAGEWQDDKDWLDDLDPDAPRPWRETHTRRVVEYGSTPALQWYAGKVVDEQGSSGRKTTRVTIVHVDTTREIPDTLFDPSSIESEEFFVPKEKLHGWHEHVALKEIDSREHWPEMPAEVAEAYWRARNAKDFQEMAVLWPGSGSWHEKALAAEEPTEYVFDEGREAASGQYYVPYCSKQYYEENGRFNLKMVLRNDRSEKGRWYITSGN